MIEWNYSDFGMKGRLREAILKPSKNTLKRVLGDRAEALRLAKLSLGEVETNRELFPVNEYDKLAYQLNLLTDVCRMAYTHMELFMRYWIAKKNPGAAPSDNDAQLALAVTAMSTLADEYLTRYGENEPLIDVETMRTFANEVTKAHGAL